jgi:hypothetical protein
VRGDGAAELHDQLQKQAENDPFLGKDLWVPAVSLCEKPDLVRGNCAQVPGPDVHLKIDGVVIQLLAAPTITSLSMMVAPATLTKYSS